MFEILCGRCRDKKMSVIKKSYKDKRYVYLVCKGCNMRVSGEFVKCFFDEKYQDKIKKMEITNKNSAKIYF